MRVSELGEFGLIRRLTAGLETRPDVLLGVGDDAAILDPGRDALLVATVDSQVEGQHFLRGVALPAEIGHKALAVNLSDIAAMGAEPLWALVSLVLPRTLETADLDGIYQGMQALAKRYGVAIVGGNVAATDGPLTLDLAVLGRVGRGRALLRSGGRPGDAILVTGTLGAAASGVLVATVPAPNGPQPTPEVLGRAHTAMAAPVPRVKEGQALSATGVVSAMLDVSDGLAADLGHLCEASNVGALLDASAIPVSPAAEAIAALYGRDPLALALAGGEDYELLFTVPPDGIQQALDAVIAAGGEAHIIGELTVPENGLHLRERDGSIRTLEPRGWDQLRSHPGRNDEGGLRT